MYGSYGSSGSSSTCSSYNSYTSYSSYSSSSMAMPMDIAPTPFSSRSSSASCAFPSWPRRSSLSESDASEERASSYLSDEDLYLDVFDDDSRSVTSSGSASPMQSPPQPQLTDADILEMQRERAAYQREVMKFLVSEKERRRQQAKRRSASSAKKAPKSKLSAMTPIAEAE